MVARMLRRAGAVAIALLVLTGCGGLAQTEMDFSDGRVSVTARDAANAAVPGVGLELVDPGDSGSLSWWTASTDANGLAGTTVMNADYLLKVTAPPGYALATGQSARVPLTVRSGQTTFITLRLQRTP